MEQTGVGEKRRIKTVLKFTMFYRLRDEPSGSSMKWQFGTYGESSSKELNS